MTRNAINKRTRILQSDARKQASEVTAAIKLPKPALDQRGSLLRALKHRQTTRSILDKRLPLQVLSNLLWAAWGVNRDKGPFGLPGRTAASASNSQEIDLYVVIEDGTYYFDPVHHKLIHVLAGDFRALTTGPGQSDLAAKAPVHLLFVADIRKLTHSSGYQEPGLQDADIQKSYYFVDTGLIAGNVYLFAASCGLACWFHNCNKVALASKLHLRTDQRILFAQTVGHAAPE